MTLNWTHRKAEGAGYTRRILLTLFAALALPVVVHAASFDCAKASTQIEKKICGSPTYSKQDEALGKAYDEALKKAADPAALKQEQSNWLKERESCLAKPQVGTCVYEMTERRLSALIASIALVDNTTPAVSLDCSSFISASGMLKLKTKELLCTDVELIALNKKLNQSFGEAFKRVTDAAVYVEQHRAWLDKIVHSSGDKLYLKSEYNQYLAALDLFLGKVSLEEIGAPADRAHVPSSPKPEPVHTPLQPTPAHQTFKLRKETDWNVCRDMVTNLNKVQPTKESLSCEISIDPSMKQFSWPNWQELKIEEHWSEVYAIESQVIGHPIMPPFEIWLAMYKAQMQAGMAWRTRWNGYEYVKHPQTFHPRLRQATVRFSSPGPVETVLGYMQERESIALCKVKDEKWRKQIGSRGLGDNIFLYDPATRQVLAIHLGGNGNGAGSILPVHLLLHDAKAYLIRTDFDMNLAYVDRTDLTKNPRRELSYWGEPACAIPTIFTTDAQ